MRRGQSDWCESLSKQERCGEYLSHLFIGLWWIKNSRKKLCHFFEVNCLRKGGKECPLRLHSKSRKHPLLMSLASLLPPCIFQEWKGPIFWNSTFWALIIKHSIINASLHDCNLSYHSQLPCDPLACLFHPSIHFILDLIPDADAMQAFSVPVSMP